MAGDGGRVPDVSEQRAEERGRFGDDRLAGPINHRRTPHDEGEWQYTEEMPRGPLVIGDPASVLAALLAESPEATASAIEALLTSDETVEAVALVIYESRLHTSFINGWSVEPEALRERFRRAARSACRSLLAKAPKEDGDA